MKNCWGEREKKAEEQSYVVNYLSYLTQGFLGEAIWGAVTISPGVVQLCALNIFTLK